MLDDKFIEPRWTIDDAWSEECVVRMQVLKGTVNIDWRTFARTAKALTYIWRRSPPQGTTRKSMPEIVRSHCLVVLFTT